MKRFTFDTRPLQSQPQLYDELGHIVDLPKKKGVKHSLDYLDLATNRDFAGILVYPMLLQLLKRTWKIGTRGLSKPQRIELADITASLLATRSINTSELANVLPREVRSDEERYRYINRWLANNKIDPIRVMNGFIPELMELMYSNDKTAILMMDQSKINCVEDAELNESGVITCIEVLMEERYNALGLLPWIVNLP